MGGPGTRLCGRSTCQLLSSSPPRSGAVPLLRRNAWCGTAFWKKDRTRNHMGSRRSYQLGGNMHIRAGTHTHTKQGRGERRKKEIETHSAASLWGPFVSKSWSRRWRRRGKGTGLGACMPAAKSKHRRGGSFSRYGKRAVRQGLARRRAGQNQGVGGIALSVQIRDSFLPDGTARSFVWSSRRFQMAKPARLGLAE
ncbi:hypothetical protein VTI28DRAFT_9412 [Corynascus sepedonium]